MIPSTTRKDHGVTIAIAVVSTIVFILVIIIICMAVHKPPVRTLVDGKEVQQAVEKLKTSYQLTPAKKQRKQKGGVKPTLYRSNFSSVLPGSITVKHGDTQVTTSHDLRAYLSPGDPIKIGPQIFQVGTVDAFTKSSLPLSQKGQWTDETGGRHTIDKNVGVIMGPDASNVSVYTPVWVATNKYQWGGPTGGAIGYWKQFTWIPGDCPGSCPQWYSPLWLGPKGKQQTLNINDGPGCDGDYCPQETQQLVQLQEPVETQGPIMQTHKRYATDSTPSVKPLMKNVNEPMANLYQVQHTDLIRESGTIQDSAQPMEPLAPLPKADHQPLGAQVGGYNQESHQELPQPLQSMNDGFTPLNRMNVNANVGELLQDEPNLIHQSTKLPDNNQLGDAMWNRQETIGTGGLFPTSTNRMAMNTRGATPGGMIQ